MTTATDFTTALGRLLRDAELREAFAQNAAAVAERLGVSTGTERMAFERLSPEDVEAQARVLLRKRYRELQGRLPATCAGQLESDHGWQVYLEFARGGWPVNAVADALAFCEWLRAQGRFVNRREMNRVRFAMRGRRFALHLVDGPSSTSRTWSLPRGQVLIRRGERVEEISLRLGW